MIADCGFMANGKRVQIIVTLLAVISGVVLAGLAWAQQNTSATLYCRWPMADCGLEEPVFFNRPSAISHRPSAGRPSAGRPSAGQPSAIGNPQSFSVWDGVYTEEQASRGEAVYRRECSSCHLATLTGGESAPPLVGAEFTANWNGLTVGDLSERIRVTMPPERPGRLSRQQQADLLAYLLSVNRFPVGKRELARETHLLNQIRFEAAKPQADSGR
jgi:mono/diheme cytochrome c family protein